MSDQLELGMSIPEKGEDVRKIPVSPKAQEAIDFRRNGNPAVSLREGAYHVKLYMEHGDYLIRVEIRKEDGFCGFGDVWHVENSRCRSICTVPEFDTFDEVAQWIDEGLNASVLMPAEIPRSSNGEITQELKRLLEKDQLTKKEQKCLDMIEKQIEIREALGGIDTIEEQFPSTLGFPVELKEDSAILLDGTVLRRTPKGEPVVKDLVGIGDEIGTNYGLKTPCGIVESVTSCTCHGLPVYSITYTPLDAKRTKDGKPAKAALCWINELVAQNGKILKLFSNSSDEVFVISKAKETPQKKTLHPFLSNLPDGYGYHISNREDGYFRAEVSFPNGDEACSDQGNLPLESRDHAEAWVVDQISFRIENAKTNPPKEGDMSEIEALKILELKKSRITNVYGDLRCFKGSNAVTDGAILELELTEKEIASLKKKYSNPSMLAEGKEHSIIPAPEDTPYQLGRPYGYQATSEKHVTYVFKVPGGLYGVQKSYYDYLTLKGYSIYAGHTQRPARLTKDGKAVGALGQVRVQSGFKILPKANLVEVEKDVAKEVA